MRAGEQVRYYLGGAMSPIAPPRRNTHLPQAPAENPWPPDASRCFCLLPLPLAFCFFPPLCLESMPVSFVLRLEAGVGK